MYLGRKVSSLLLAGGTLVGVTAFGVSAVGVSPSWANTCPATSPGQVCGDPSTTSISASQYTGLSSGNVVTVTGSGFSPNQIVGLSMCKGKGAAKDNCDANTDQTTIADANGAFTIQFTVSSPIMVKNKKGKTISFNCGSTSKYCSIGSSDFHNSPPIPAAYEIVSF